MPISFASTALHNYGPGTAIDHKTRQKYKGNIPSSTIYNCLYTINGFKLRMLLLLGFLSASLILLLFSLLYTFGGCYDVPFHEVLLVTFLQVMGTTSDTTMSSSASRGYCGIVLSGTSLLQVGFKSVVFAVMVNKLTKITPKLFFTPNAVINYRDGKPVIMVRILNAQGSVLELIQIQAQWVIPHTTEEGEHHGKLHDLEMSAFHRLRSPITLSHVIDASSPMCNQDLEKLFGKIFITAVFWDPANQREVRHSAKYDLGTDCKYNHRFADLTTTLPNGSFAADVSLYGVTLPLEDTGSNVGGDGGAGGGAGSKYTYSAYMDVKDNIDQDEEEEHNTTIPWYVPNWNLPENAAKLNDGIVTLLVGARFHQGRLIPRCDFSAFVEMSMIECRIPYRRYLLDLDNKETYVRHLPKEIAKKNIPFLNNGGIGGGSNGNGSSEWFSLSVTCTNAALDTKPTSEFVKSFRLHSPELPSYDHKTFSDAGMRHLMAKKGDPEEAEGKKEMNAFLSIYETYLEKSGTLYLGGDEGPNISDCQLIPHVSAMCALWCRVKRNNMLEDFPRLRKWHKTLIQRESFQQTWPKGYSLEGAIDLVGHMAVEKAKVMYKFNFPDLDLRRVLSVRGRRGNNNTGSDAASSNFPQKQKSSMSLGAYCL
jgi:hypothetical protein